VMICPLIGDVHPVFLTPGFTDFLRDCRHFPVIARGLLRPGIRVPNYPANTLS
jgi:hypothetical protein